MKRRLARKYIPSSVKWKLVLKGVGKLYSAIYEELERNKGNPSGKKLADAAYRVGLDFGEDLKREFQLGNSVGDIVFALDMEHRIFGMRASVVERSDRKIVYHCYECAWQKYFSPKLCIAIGQAEKGITHAINYETKYSILQTRTMGKEYCVFSIELSSPMNIV